MQTLSRGAQNSVLLRNARGYTDYISNNFWSLGVSSGFILFFHPIPYYLCVCFCQNCYSFLLSCYTLQTHNGKTWDKNMKIPVGSAGSPHPPERNSSSCLPYEGLPNTTYDISWVLPHFVPFSHTAR